MGLLLTLGLKPLVVKQPATAGAGAAGDEPGTPAPPTPDAPADAGADPVVEQHDIVAEMIASIGDEKAKAALDTELAALRAKHAKSPSPKAELAAAAKLYEKAKKIAFAEQQKRELSDTRADIDAIVQQITALVLGGISEDAPRNKINAELTKLKADVAKAGKNADPKAAIAAFNALLGTAQALLARAQAVKDTADLAQSKVAPLVAAAQSAVVAAPDGPKAVLQKELDSLRSDIKRYSEASDSTALQSIVMPRLQKLATVAASIAKLSTQADADIARAAKLVGALDPAASAELQTA